MGLYRLKGRADQDMVKITDASDLVVTFPVAPAIIPTEIFVKTYDPKEFVWISFTGLAGVVNWTKHFPYKGITILKPTVALKMYLRKPRNRTPDVFRQTSDDTIIDIEIEYIVRT